MHLNLRANYCVLDTYRANYATHLKKIVLEVTVGGRRRRRREILKVIDDTEIIEESTWSSGIERIGDITRSIIRTHYDDDDD